MRLQREARARGGMGAPAGADLLNTCTGGLAVVRQSGRPQGRPLIMYGSECMDILRRVCKYAVTMHGVVCGLQYLVV